MRRAATLASSPDRTDRSPVPFSRRPLRFAHRGASSRAPENTLAAFEEAIGLGVDAIELDVHLSADGIPVVIHDERVDRTTDGHGLVSALTFGALRGLDAGAWFDRRFRGERIPSLDEALDLTRERCGLNIEIKAEQPAPARRAGPRRRGAIRAGSGSQDLIAAVRASLRRARFPGMLVLSSFDPETLLRARAAMPRIHLGLLASRSARGLLPLHKRIALYSFNAHHRLAGRERIRRAHAERLAVFVWPVNDLALMRRLVERRADGLMTDDPALFRGLQASPPPRETGRWPEAIVEPGRAGPIRR